MGLRHLNNLNKLNLLNQRFKNVLPFRIVVSVALVLMTGLILGVSVQESFARTSPSSSHFVAQGSVLKPVAHQHTQTSYGDQEKDVPLSDLWEEESRDSPEKSSWVIRSATGFAVVLVLLLVFFRWVFPLLAKKNPQWKKGKGESSSLQASLQKTDDEKQYVPVTEESFQSNTGESSEPDLKTFLQSVKQQESLRGASSVSTSYTGAMHSPSSPFPVFASGSAESSKVAVPTLGLPLNTLPLTVIREFVVGQGVRLQLVTVWERYLVILQAPDGVELIGEVQCDRDAGYVRFEETVGQPSERISWLFHYHSSSIQQCVDTVAERESSGDTQSHSLQNELNASPDTPSRSVQVTQNVQAEESSGSVQGVVHPLQNQISHNADPVLKPTPQRQSELEPDLEPKPKPEQPIYPDYRAVNEPAKEHGNFHSTYSEPILEREEPMMETNSDSGSGVYLKYVSQDQAIESGQTSPVFHTVEGEPAPYVQESEEFLDSQNLQEAQTVFSSPSPESFSPNVQQDLEALPKPWYAQPSPEELLQSKALKETLNQMVHDVLEAEMIQHQRPENNRASVSEQSAKTAYSEPPQKPLPAPQPLFEEDDLSMSSAVSNISKDEHRIHAHSQVQQQEMEWEDELTDLSVLNLAASDVVVEPEAPPVRNVTADQPLPDEQNREESGIVLGELNLDDPLPQVKEPSVVSEKPEPIKKPDESAPSLTERMSQQVSGSSESLSEAVQNASDVKENRGKLSQDEEVYPLSGLSRKRELTKEKEQEHDSVEASLKDLLFPSSATESENIKPLTQLKKTTQAEESLSEPQLVASSHSSPEVPSASTSAQTVPRPSMSDRSLETKKMEKQSMPSPASSVMPRPAHAMPEEIVVLDDYDDVY